MNYRQTVICPMPGCEWEAVIEHADPEDEMVASPWRNGVIRDALNRLRELHIIDTHATVTTPA